MDHIQHSAHETPGRATRFSCPMHPEVVSDKAGLCSECGMALLATRIDPSTELGASAEPRRIAKEHKRGEHDKHAGHSTGMFLRKFWVSLILTIPVVLYSDIFQTLFGFRLPTLEIRNLELEILTPLVLGSIVFFYGGWIFLASAWRELTAKLPGMMTLISLAISTAYLYSVGVTVAGEGSPLFWELTTLITVMLLGHYLEMRAVSGAQGALKELSK
ncbi:MAG: hypothetical protein HY459_04140, partial [Parcubacteria group bacterium]|nr:hypothetical protein [Parcubacteria group bacterium]